MPQKALEKVLADRFRSKTPTKESIEAAHQKPKTKREAIIQAMDRSWIHRNFFPGVSGLAYPDDLPYLRQYLEPDKNYLPKTSQRPQNATIKTRDVRQSVMPDQVRAFDPAYTKLPEKGKILDLATGAMGNNAGLGHYTASLGRDDKGPYASLYDVWDFDSPMIKSGIVQKLMGLIGTPYTVYDRFDVKQTPLVDPDNPDKKFLPRTTLIRRK